MDKSELLFQMMEHPERYSDEQWSEVLADDECKELYTMLSKIQSAIEVESIGKQQIDREWDKFLVNHDARSNSLHWQRMAAVAAIAIVCVGLAIAAVYTHFFSTNDTCKRPTPTVENATATTKPATISGQDVQTEEPQSHLYDNVPLEEIINDLSAHYNVQPEWHGNEVRSLRLYYKWEPEFTLDEVVEMLNNFEAFSVSIVGDKLIVTSNDLMVNQ